MRPMTDFPDGNFLLTTEVSNYSDTFFLYVINNTNDSDTEAVARGILAYPTIPLVLLCTILALMILATIIGNVFVIAAILLERSLQAVSNYLILSLAVTDLMVASLVMPISAVNEVSLRWILGGWLCDVWISFDVLCCTGSILHLVAIAFDRFWAVSNIDYIRKRTAKKILTMILVVWVLSLSISIPPVFGWRDMDTTVDITGQCMISQDYGYTLFSTIGAFYFPLVLMVVINIRIYKVARSRIRKKKFGGRTKVRTQEIVTKETGINNANNIPITTVTAVDGGPISMNGSSSDVDSLDAYSSYNGSCIMMDEVSRMDSSCDIADDDVSVCGLQEDSGVELTTPNTLGVGGRGEVSLRVPSVSPGFKLSPNNLTLPKSGINIRISGVRKGSFCRMSPVIPPHPPAPPPPPPPPPPQIKETTTVTKPSPKQTKSPRSNNNNKKTRQKEKARLRKEKIEMKRERKAARVLAIITGAFIVCWLPFFILAVLGPFCGPNCIPGPVFSLFLWLGYFNSLLNPIIYTIFNPHFRTAFRKILFGKYRMVKLVR